MGGFQGLGVTLMLVTLTFDGMTSAKGTWDVTPKQKPEVNRYDEFHGHYESYFKPKFEEINAKSLPALANTKLEFCQGLMLDFTKKLHIYMDCSIPQYDIINFNLCTSCAEQFLAMGEAFVRMDTNVSPGVTRYRRDYNKSQEDALVNTWHKVNNVLARALRKLGLKKLSTPTCWEYFQTHDDLGNYDTLFKYAIWKDSAWVKGECETCFTKESLVPGYLPPQYNAATKSMMSDFDKFGACALQEEAWLTEEQFREEYIKEWKMVESGMTPEEIEKVKALQRPKNHTVCTKCANIYYNTSLHFKSPWVFMPQSETPFYKTGCQDTARRFYHVRHVWHKFGCEIEPRPNAVPTSLSIYIILAVVALFGIGYLTTLSRNSHWLVVGYRRYGWRYFRLNRLYDIPAEFEAQRLVNEMIDQVNQQRDDEITARAEQITEEVLRRENEEREMSPEQLMHRREELLVSNREMQVTDQQLAREEREYEEYQKRFMAREHNPELVEQDEREREEREERENQEGSAVGLRQRRRGE